MLLYELKGHTVKVAVNFDMVIDIHLGLFPFRIFKGASGKRLESRPVQGFKQGCAGGVELVEFSVVKLGEFFGNGRV